MPWLILNEYENTTLMLSIAHSRVFCLFFGYKTMREKTKKKQLQKICHTFIGPIRRNDLPLERGDFHIIERAHKCARLQIPKLGTAIAQKHKQISARM